MGEKKDRPAVGSVTWIDLTADDATGIRDFYGSVVGWKPAPVEMDGYDDYMMAVPDGGDAVAGVCHARGTNAGLPSQWLIYITVADVEASAAECEKLGGRVLVAPREMGGHGRYCVIRDPAGAVCALFTPAGD